MKIINILPKKHKKCVYTAHGTNNEIKKKTDKKLEPFKLNHGGPMSMYDINIPCSRSG